MRKITLFLATCALEVLLLDRAVARVAAAPVHPTADDEQRVHAAVREPSGLYRKRASRIGPSGLMNEGTLLRAPKALASGTWGLLRGLVPPTAGWM